MKKVSEIKRDLNNATSEEQRADDEKDRLEAEEAKQKRRKEKHTKIFEEIQSYLEEFSSFIGQKIDLDTMMLDIIPASEIKNNNIFNESCKSKDLELLEEVSNKIENINETDHQDMSLLMYSLKYEFWEGVNLLINKGANLSINTNSDTNINNKFKLDDNLKKQLIINLERFTAMEQGANHIGVLLFAAKNFDLESKFNKPNMPKEVVNNIIKPIFEIKNKI